MIILSGVDCTRYWVLNRKKSRFNFKKSFVVTLAFQFKVKAGFVSLRNMILYARVIIDFYFVFVWFHRNGNESIIISLEI